MSLSENQMIFLLGCFTRYLEAMKKGNKRDAQIFKDMLTKEMQVIINATNRKKHISNAKRKRN